MSPAFISGITAHLANADITFDRFHIMKKLGDEESIRTWAAPVGVRRCDGMSS